MAIRADESQGEFATTMSPASGLAALGVALTAGLTLTLVMVDSTGTSDVDGQRIETASGPDEAPPAAASPAATTPELTGDAGEGAQPELLVVADLTDGARPEALADGTDIGEVTGQAGDESAGAAPEGDDASTNDGAGGITPSTDGQPTSSAATGGSSEGGSTTARRQTDRQPAPSSSSSSSPSATSTAKRTASTAAPSTAAPSTAAPGTAAPTTKPPSTAAPTTKPPSHRAAEHRRPIDRRPPPTPQARR